MRRVEVTLRRRRQEHPAVAGGALREGLVLERHVRAGRAADSAERGQPGLGVGRRQRLRERGADFRRGGVVRGVQDGDPGYRFPAVRVLHLPAQALLLLRKERADVSAS